MEISFAKRPLEQKGLLSINNSMLCIREEKKRLAQQIDARADEPSREQAGHHSVSTDGLKTCRVFVLFHHSNEERQKKERSLRGWLLNSEQQTAGHNRLNSWPPPDSPSSFDVCQSQRKGQLCFFWIYLWPGLPYRAEWTNRGDTNCTPFDISISTAGCAAMRRRQKSASQKGTD